MKAGWKRGREEGRRDGKWGTCLKEGVERGGGGGGGGGWISNLRGEMNRKGSCGEMGEEN